MLKDLWTPKVQQHIADLLQKYPTSRMLCYLEQRPALMFQDKRNTMHGKGSHLSFSPNKLCWFVRAPTNAAWSPATAVESNGDVFCQWQIGQLMYDLARPASLPGHLRYYESTVQHNVMISDCAPTSYIVSTLQTIQTLQSKGKAECIYTSPSWAVEEACMPLWSYRNDQSVNAQKPATVINTSTDRSRMSHLSQSWMRLGKRPQGTL